VWDVTVEVMEEALRDLEFDGDDIVYNWRKDANMKRRERELFEKYGFMKEVILNPTFQAWKQWFDELWDQNTPSMDMTLGEPMLPLVTAIIVMYMMHKRVPNDVLVLAGGLIFNVNPIYVVAGTIVFHLSSKWMRSKPRQYVKKKAAVVAVSSSGNDDVAVPYTQSQLHKENKEDDSTGIANNLFDHVLIGSDISTLFAAALLSKVGHRCCVLQPEGDSPSEVRPEEAPCTVPLENITVCKPERYQSLLDLVQKDTPDMQRVHLVPTGRPEEGYAFALVRPLADNTTAAAARDMNNNIIGSNGGGGTRSLSWKKALGTPISLKDMWCLRPSLTGFVSDLASHFLLDASALSDFFSKVAMSQHFVTSFLVNRGFPAAVQQPAVGSTGPAVVKSDADKAFESVSLLSVADILASTGLEPGSPAFNIVVGAALSCSNELGVSPHECSGNVLAQALAGMESGLFYPRGGIVAMEKVFIAAIRRAGGQVISNAPVKEIVMEPTKQVEGGGDNAAAAAQTAGDKASLARYTADRVALEGGRDVYANKTIISGMGVIGTYSNFMFGSESDNVDPSHLSAMKKRVFGTTLADLQEAKPVQKAVFWLSAADEGSSSSRSSSSSSKDGSGGNNIDYADMPGPVDYVEYHPGGESSDGSSPSLRVWSPSAKDSSWKERHPDIAVLVMEYECSEPYVCKRVMTGGVGGGGGGGDNSSTTGRGPAVYVRRSEDVYITEQYQSEFLRYAEKKLQQLYPRLAADNRIIHTCAVLPSRYEGQRCANTVSKYAKPLSACSELQGLYLCGRDLATSGLSADLQGAFVCVNAVLGYSLEDKSALRNVISDLKNV
jgi:hypothetical protein